MSENLLVHAHYPKAEVAVLVHMYMRASKNNLGGSNYDAHARSLRRIMGGSVEAGSDGTWALADVSIRVSGDNAPPGPFHANHIAAALDLNN